MTKLNILRGLRNTSIYLTFFCLAFAIVMLVCFCVTSMLVMFTNLGVNEQLPDFLACATLTIGSLAILFGLMCGVFGVWHDVESEKHSKN